MSGLPSGFETAQPDLQKLDFRVQAQLVLLKPEDVFVKGDASGRVLAPQKVEDFCLDRGLLGPETVYFPFYGFNL